MNARRPARNRGISFLLFAMLLSGGLPVGHALAQETIELRCKIFACPFLSPDCGVHLRDQTFIVDLNRQVRDENGRCCIIRSRPYRINVHHDKLYFFHDNQDEVIDIDRYSGALTGQMGKGPRFRWLGGSCQRAKRQF